MAIININTEQGVKFTLFPDGQPHVNVPNLRPDEDVVVVCSITSVRSLMHLLMVANVIEHSFARKSVLVIPYLMGARSDRMMNPGDSVDIEVIANLINSMNFAKVKLFDVHSDVSTALIKNSVNYDNKLLVNRYELPNSVLICPDAGAAKKIGKYLEWNKNLVDVVYCIKDRNLATGDLRLKVLEPEKCIGRNCVIIDDLCDAGGTFLGIASQIQPKTLTLIVTHGLFSKGFDALEKSFDNIITSDSYRYPVNGIVEVVLVTDMK